MLYDVQLVVLDRGLSCQLTGAPELYYLRVSQAPLVDHALQLLVRDRAALIHLTHRTDAALVPAGQHGDLALLSQLCVLPVFFYRHVVHHTGRFAVDILAGLKRIQHPLLTRDPCDHPGLDRAKIRHDEAVTV